MWIYIQQDEDKNVNINQASKQEQSETASHKIQMSMKNTMVEARNIYNK